MNQDLELDAGAEEPRVQTKSVRQAEKAFSKFYHDRGTEDLAHAVKRSRRRRGWLYLTSALGILLAAALVALYMIQSGKVGKFGEENVQFALSAPAESPSGQEVVLELSYENGQNVGLRDVEVTMRYPDGFTFASAEPLPDNTEGTRFRLRRVDEGASGKLTVRGQLVGEVGEEKRFSAVVDYEPENLNAQYNKIVNASVKLVASVLNLELAGPSQLPAGGQPLVVSATYKNSSTSKLERLAVRLTSPGGFELEVPQLEPVPNSQSTWRLPDLEPKAEGKVEFKGTFTDAATAGGQELRVAVGLVNEDGSFTVQEEKNHAFTLVRSAFILDLTVNDVSLKSAVDAGQELEYQLTYANEGELPFTNIQLIAKLNPAFFDWSTFRDGSGSRADASAGTITWTSQEVPSLTHLSPSSRGVLRWSVRLNGALPQDGTGVSFVSYVEATGTQVLSPDREQEFTAKSNDVASRINTRFTLDAQGRYYTEELVKIGSGPLPPKVGETTTYVILWKLGNTSNEVENIEVTTTLPEGVSWTGQSTVTAGQNLTFNPNTREAKWQLNRLPAGAGTSFAKPEATFEVAITPQSADADKILVLSKTTTATAKDTYSEANLIATAKFITTEIDDDLAAQGKGIVVR